MSFNSIIVEKKKLKYNQICKLNVKPRNFFPYKICHMQTLKNSIVNN